VPTPLDELWVRVGDPVVKWIEERKECEKSLESLDVLRIILLTQVSYHHHYYYYLHYSGRYDEKQNP
jgi:hypothetical protein